MILGYNQPRRKEENYRDFQSKLVSGLKGLGIDGLSLMFYGSFVRGYYNPGRSDIDAVLEFPDDVVIDKANIGLCAKVLAESLEGNHIPFQVSVCDRTTSEDGRFNSYTADFDEYFREEGMILVGPDFRDYMQFESQKTGDLHSISFNLRKSRLGLLFAQYHLEHDYERMLKDFGKTLDSTSRGSKQILHLADGTIRKNRFSALERIRSDFPDVEVEPLERIKAIYIEPSKLDALYQNPQEMFSLWNSALTTFEQIVRSYIRQHPKRQSE
jgi:predicted nucleotidyltransferase